MPKNQSPYTPHNNPNGMPQNPKKPNSNGERRYLNQEMQEAQKQQELIDNYENALWNGVAFTPQTNGDWIVTDNLGKNIRIEAKNYSRFYNDWNNVQTQKKAMINAPVPISVSPAIPIENYNRNNYHVRNGNDAPNMHTNEGVRNMAKNNPNNIYRFLSSTNDVIIVNPIEIKDKNGRVIERDFESKFILPQGLASKFNCPSLISTHKEMLTYYKLIQSDFTLINEYLKKYPNQVAFTNLINAGILNKSIPISRYEEATNFVNSLYRNNLNLTSAEVILLLQKIHESNEPISRIFTRLRGSKRTK